MPQLFQILKCYECSIFQVHQTKKVLMFSCKICGEKQSIKQIKHYALGNARECRLHVQKLNSIQGEIIETFNNTSDSIENTLVDDLQYANSSHEPKVKQSKWLSYMDKNYNKLQLRSEEIKDSNKTKGALEIPIKKQLTKRQNYIKDRHSSAFSKLNDNANCNADSDYCTDIAKTKPSWDIVKKVPIKFVSHNTITTGAQLVEEPQEPSQASNLLHSQDPKKPYATGSLFSLFDDNDLDSILDV